MSFFIDMGMRLGLGILVVQVDEEGLATRCGIKPGDQICQVSVKEWHY